MRQIEQGQTNNRPSISRMEYIKIFGRKPEGIQKRFQIIEPDEVVFVDHGWYSDIQFRQGERYWISDPDHTVMHEGMKYGWADHWVRLNEAVRVIMRWSEDMEKREQGEVPPWLGLF